MKIVYFGQSKSAFLLQRESIIHLRLSITCGDDIRMMLDKYGHKPLFGFEFNQTLIWQSQKECRGKGYSFFF